MSLQCDECGIGSLSPAVWEGVFRHGDASIKVTGLECHRCSHCGADPVFTDQIRRNQARIADAKRAHDGLLTGEQVRGVRESLKLSQQLAAHERTQQALKESEALRQTQRQSQGLKQ